MTKGRRLEERRLRSVYLAAVLFNRDRDGADQRLLCYLVRSGLRVGIDRNLLIGFVH